MNKQKELKQNIEYLTKLTSEKGDKLIEITYDNKQKLRNSKIKYSCLSCKKA